MSRPSRPLLLLTLLLAAGSLFLLLHDAPGPTPEPLDPGEDDTTDGAATPDPLRSDGSSSGAGGEVDPASGLRARREDRAFITGLVVGDGERPIRAATVTVYPVDTRSLRGAPYPDGGKLGEARSDGDGRFRVPAPFDTWLRVVASASGRATVGILVASTGTEVILRLPPTCPLQVSVRDEADRPVADAEVEVRVDELRATARSDADGSCRFEALPPGSALIRARAAGFGRVRAGPFRLTPGKDTATTVVLTPAVSVAGTVVDEDGGGPVAGARVFVARPGESEEAKPTGSDGRFGPLHGGGRGERIFISAEAAGYAPILQPVILGQKGVQDIVVRLRKAAAWSGRVVSPKGLAVPGAWVGYTDDGVAGRAPASTRTNPDGHFELPPPPPPAPGRRVVLHARHALGEAALALRPDSLVPDPLVLVLSGGSYVSGRVTDAEGRSLAGVQVRLAPEWRQVGDRSRPDAATSRLLLANEAGFAGFASATDAAGEWWLGGIPAGPYHVRFSWLGREQRRGEVLEVGVGGAAAGTEILGQGFRLAGRVLDGRGRPVAGVTVRAAALGESRTLHRATTDVDGEYGFASLQGGKYRISAQLVWASARTEVITLEAEVLGADLVFDQEAVLAGRVLVAAEPYTGLLTLRLRPANARQRGRPPRSLRVQDGSFRWEGVPVGSYRVEGRAPGKRLGVSGQAVELEAGRVASVTLTLAPAADLRGRVLTPAGTPVPSANVKLLEVNGERRQLATTDAGGRFVFEDLVPGQYEVSAWGRGGAAMRASVGLAVGESRSLDLKLAPSGAAEVRVVDARDQRVAAAVVTFRTGDGTLVPSARPDRTGRDGAVVRAGLPLGDVFVQALAPNGRKGRVRIRIAENKTTAVSVRLAE